MNAFKGWLASTTDAGSPAPEQAQRRPNQRKHPIKRANLRQVRSESHWAKKRAEANGDPKALADVERSAVWSRVHHLPAEEQAAAWQWVARTLQNLAHDL